MAFSKARISIPNVTGNVVITATAVPSAIPNLFVKTPQYTPTSTGTSVDEVAIGGRLATGGEVKYWKGGRLTTRFVEVSPGDVVVVSTDKGEEEDFDWIAALYASDKSYIRNIDPQTEQTHTSDRKVWTYTIPSSVSNVAYFKVTIPYGNIDAITILINPM